MAYRVERIEKIIEREIGNILLSEVKDQRLRYVTITNVKVTNDLSIATVFYTIIGDENQIVSTKKNLEDAKGFIRSKLSKVLEIRKTPELRFKYDESFEYGNKIEEILKPKTLWEKIKSLFKKEKYFSKDATAADWWLLTNMMSERAYMELTEKHKWTAQQGRSILPCDLNTEIVMTGFMSDWIHFFNLRSLGLTGAPHPDIKVLADGLKDEFIKRGYILEKQLGKE